MLLLVLPLLVASTFDAVVVAVSVLLLSDGSSVAGDTAVAGNLFARP